MQNIIRAFGRTPPELVDADTPFPAHQRMSCGTLSPRPPSSTARRKAVEGPRGGSVSSVHGVLCTAGFDRRARGAMRK